MKTLNQRNTMQADVLTTMTAFAMGTTTDHHLG